MELPIYNWKRKWVREPYYRQIYLCQIPGVQAEAHSSNFARLLDSQHCSNHHVYHQHIGTVSIITVDISIIIIQNCFSENHVFATFSSPSFDSNKSKRYYYFSLRCKSQHWPTHLSTSWRRSGISGIFSSLAGKYFYFLNTEDPTTPTSSCQL